MRKLVTITTKSIKEKLRGIENISFLYPLKSFCVGYTNYYDVEDIDDYVLVNRLLEEDELEQLSLILKKANIKGIVFDDLGIIERTKDLNIKRILLLDHLATNSESINYYLDYVDSVVVSSDLEKQEIEEILKKSKKDLVVNVFGRKKLMYSRRLLLTNYAKYHKLDIKKHIDAQVPNKEFFIKEDEKGTCFFAKDYYNALELLNLSNVLYFWYDLDGIEEKEALNIILKNEINVANDSLFLHDNMIFKLKELKEDKND